MTDRAPDSHPKYGAVEEYARGEIRAYHGIVNKWLLVVYAALAALSAFVWGAVSGAFRDIEAIKHQVLEVEDDGNERA